MIQGSQQLSRRDWMGTIAMGASLAVGLVNTHDDSKGSQGAMERPGELTNLSVVALAKAIRTKQVSSREVVEAYLRRSNKSIPRLMQWSN